MLEKRTTLILGAGASRPYGFPVGTELLDRMLTADGGFLQALGSLNFNASEWERVQDTLHRFQADSIDEFLVQYPDDAELTKMAIAFWLTKSENAKAHQNPNNLNSWYRALLVEVLRNDPLLGDGMLSVVTFNYDLSLEAYVVETVKARHHISVERAMQGLAKLQIQHIYGDLGPTLTTHQTGRPYGPLSTSEALRAAEKNISTCFETQSRDAVAKAKNLIKESANVLFLGFGYSDENLKRLDLQNCVSAGAVVYGSVHRSPDGFERLRAAIRNHRDVYKVQVASGVAETVDLARRLFTLAAGGK